MSDVFFPDEGLIGSFEDGGPLVEEYILALYTAPPTITAATTFGDLTLATFTGSTPLPLDDWVTPPVIEDGKAVITAPEKVFTRTGGATETILGAVVLNADGDEIRWVAPDPNGGFTLNVAGATYTVVPRLESGNAA